MSLTTGTSAKNDVPNPTALLAIQLGGGGLALLPILSLNSFAKLSNSLHQLLIYSAVANVVLSAALLICFLGKFNFLLRAIDRIGELGICRGLIVYDMLMLGGLVYFTGGSDKSSFAPLFAAVLPVAMLIRDVPAAKWSYAGVFLFMFLIGLSPSSLFEGYLDHSEARERWFLIFFFILNLFPVIYSIQSEPTSLAAPTPATPGIGAPGAPATVAGAPSQSTSNTSPNDSYGSGND
jgi:hypothetical protein